MNIHPRPPIPPPPLSRTPPLRGTRKSALRPLPTRPQGPSGLLLRAIGLVGLATLTSLHAQTTRLDIAVVYTPAVTAYYGSPEGVEAHLLAMMAGSNAVLTNSQIDAFFYLVHAEEIAYSESAFLAEDLDRLQDPTDGIMDSVHTLRNATGADVVCLLRRGFGSDAAGIAYQLQDAVTGRQDLAFAVVADAGSLSQLVFAHEMGHVMGAEHARGDDPPQFTIPLFPYSFAYKFRGNDGQDYRTVMGTVDNRIRIPYFSNPNLTFAGVPIGRAAASASSADNARTLNQSRLVVGAYRTQQPQLPRIASEPRDQTVIAGAPIIVPATAYGPPPLNLQWYEGTTGEVASPLPGATAEVLNLGTASANRRFWLRATASSGQADSYGATIAVLPTAPTPITLLAEQPSTAGGFFFVEEGDYQRLVFTQPYLDRIEIQLFSEPQESSGGLVASLIGPGGLLVARQRVSEAAFPDGFLRWVSFPFRRFVVPGVTYRLDLAPELPEGLFFWGGAQGNPYTAARSSIEENFGDSFPGWDYSFRIYGANATAYTVWQEQQGLVGPASAPNARSGSAQLPNALRYALGLDEPDGSTLPRLPDIQLNPTGTAAAVAFQRRQRMADASLLLRRSNNLTDWQIIPENSWISDGQAAAGVNAYQTSVPLPAHPESLFLRLEVDLPSAD